MFEFEYDDTPSEKKSFKLVSEGKAFFCIKKAEKCVSKAGNNQLKLMVSLSDDFGTTNTIFVYLPALKQFKDLLKAVLNACGLGHLYNNSSAFDENELVGCTGCCLVKHEFNNEFGTQPKIKLWYDKNEEPKPHHAQQATKASIADDFDDLDGIPF